MCGLIYTQFAVNICLCSVLVIYIFGVKPSSNGISLRHKTVCCIPSIKAVQWSQHPQHVLSAMTTGHLILGAQ